MRKIINRISDSFRATKLKIGKYIIEIGFFKITIHIPHNKDNF